MKVSQYLWLEEAIDAEFLDGDEDNIKFQVAFH